VRQATDNYLKKNCCRTGHQQLLSLPQAIQRLTEYFVGDFQSLATEQACFRVIDQVQISQAVEACGRDLC
jgi:hypothetical protein